MTRGAQPACTDFLEMAVAAERAGEGAGAERVFALVARLSGAP